MLPVVLHKVVTKVFENRKPRGELGCGESTIGPKWKRLGTGWAHLEKYKTIRLEEQDDTPQVKFSCVVQRKLPRLDKSLLHLPRI